MRGFSTWPWLFSEACGPTFPFEPFVSPSHTLWLCSVHSSPITTAGCSCKDADCVRPVKPHLVRSGPFFLDEYPQAGDPVGHRNVVTLISIVDRFPISLYWEF